MNITKRDAELLCLQHKLSAIRKHIENRLEVVDPMVKAELSIILNIISRYEVVDKTWSLDRPLVSLDIVKNAANSAEEEFENE